ncbi:MAG: PD-(D/E)XK nuclease domain-containing protein, partial [Muribaculaceae bacterium]|nr:PD-(D/E)XK nuclease domain-containing protein [Muribaculaceae bacterium]
SAREALDQINSKEYALPFKTDGKTIIKIGINFSTKARTISDWIVEAISNE